MAAKTATATAGLGQLETVLDEYLVKKAPALPANIKELLVKFAPYLTIIGVVLAVPAIITLLGLGAVVSTSVYVVGAAVGYHYYLGILFTVLTLVLEALAIPGLFARSKKGWNLLYYSTLVSAVYALVSLNFFGLIIGTLISLYFLFQVKSYYK